MPIYHTLGSIPRKRHTAFRKPNGGIYAEELMGHEGFTGTSALLYHVHPPTTVKSVRRLCETAFEPDPDRALRHRHFHTAQAKKGGSPTLDRIPILFNQDIAMLYVEPDKEDEHFYRNAQADELIYVAKGKGLLETVFGELPFGEGDYLIIHRGILHRYRFETSGDKPKLLVFESRGHVRWPKRYRNEFGQLKEGAPYSERDIRLPLKLNTHDEMGDFRLLVKQYDGINELILDHHPFDVIGWDGYFYPWAFNIRDFDPNAVPAPYNHSNVDSDEVLYYASSEFMSRKGIEFGSITHHPDGIPHGPHPGRAEASIGAKYTDELAVMMDSFRPLKVAKPALEIEDPNYHKSWLQGQHAQFNPPTS